MRNGVIIYLNSRGIILFFPLRLDLLLRDQETELSLLRQCFWINQSTDYKHLGSLNPGKTEPIGIAQPLLAVIEVDATRLSVGFTGR